MCFAPDPPEDRSAEIARQQEEERRRRIQQGRERIDDIFGQRFGDPYYAGLRKDYTGYYLPQLEDQYGDARRKLTLKQAQSGHLHSGAGARTFGDLLERYEKNRAMIGSRAGSYADKARSDVEAARTQLYQQNRSAADPSAAASAAMSRAGTLTAQPEFSPLGSVFADFINNAATAVKAEKSGYRGWNTGLFNNTPSRETVVRG